MNTQCTGPRWASSPESGPARDVSTLLLIAIMDNNSHHADGAKQHPKYPHSDDDRRVDGGLFHMLA